MIRSFTFHFPHGFLIPPTTSALRPNFPGPKHNFETTEEAAMLTVKATLQQKVFLLSLSRFILKVVFLCKNLRRPRSELCRKCNNMKCERGFDVTRFSA